MLRARPWMLAPVVALALAFGGASSLSGCSTDVGASARIITSRAELIGGDRAIGEVGDYIIENEKVRFIIQKAGPSRGFGVFGGSLIDADLRRPVEHSAGGDGLGHDQFAEMFPGMFLQAVAVDEVTVTRSGEDGGSAQIEASGYGGDFFEMLAVFNRVLTGSHVSYLTPLSAPRLRYSSIYELAPGNQYLTVRFRAENISTIPLEFPSADKSLLETAGLDMTGFTVPVGDVALFGATSRLFIPGAGFDLRFGLDRAYAKDTPWPAFPGLLAEFIASKGEDTSYGLVAKPSDRNFVMSKKDLYDDGEVPLTDSTMLIPFTTAGAIGAFYDNAPNTLAPGDAFEVERYFVVGSGDVGSVVDVVNEIRGSSTGRLTAKVVDSTMGTNASGVSIVVYQRLASGARRIFSQYDVKSDGVATGTLPVGAYSLRLTGDGRTTSDFMDFEITAEHTSALRIESMPPAHIYVHLRDDRGLPLPAKATAIGTYGAEHAGQATPTFLFDLPAGDDYRTTDLITDDPNDASTRQFIEAAAVTHEGVADLVVRPGTYDVVMSRGPEYNLVTKRVSVTADNPATIEDKLLRVVDTNGWVALDSHVHSRESPDSAITLDDRVLALAAEGVEVPVATDHNVVTDYRPYVARNSLTEWMHPVVGVELTTLESGHFNGYPLQYDPGQSTHGSFEWAGLPPKTIFEKLRERGSLSPGQTIVQVNHPRDDVLGYYGQYARNGFTHAELPVTGFDVFLQPKGPAFLDDFGATTFSFDYEAVELANGKLYWEIHHFRVPEELPDGELPDVVPPAGSILTDETGDVAFPGVVDDWFNLLNLGYTYIGVGTCDSHSANDEAGQFRTMVYVGDDHPANVTDAGLVAALRSRRAVVTNGPLVDFYINDPSAGAMGKTVKDNDGAVSLNLSVTSAPWIDVGRVNVYRNGVIVQAIDLDAGRDLAANPLKQALDLALDTDENGAFKDSWFVVEAIGYKSMFPVIRPAEVPSLMLIDAVSSLAGPLGLGQDGFGALRPSEVFQVTPYAITNPVWVKTSDGDFQPPGLVPFEVQNKPENDPHFEPGARAKWTVPAPERRVKRSTEVGEQCLPGKRCVPMLDPVEKNRFDIRRAILRYGTSHGH